MKELVEKSGFTKGAFYHYFESKESLFREVVERFSSMAMVRTKPETDGLSLRRFYRADATRLAASLISQDDNEKDVGSNYLKLIMDALLLFPDLAEQLLVFDNTQNDCWIEVIQAAKDSGEISSAMSNEHIAKMFRYSADGASMYRTLFNDTENFEDELIALWDDYYISLIR
jgi:AcrR family transcriptional regulator